MFDYSNNYTEEILCTLQLTLGILYPYFILPQQHKTIYTAIIPKSP